jgi:hypothetical protein
MITNIDILKKQPALVELLQVFLNNSKTYMSTVDLQESGIMSPAAGVARLKEKGVVFETNYQSVVDSSGRLRKRIACNHIVGGVTL